MSKANKIATAIRLVDPSSGSTKGEREAAIAALERMVDDGENEGDYIFAIDLEIDLETGETTIIQVDQ